MKIDTVWLVWTRHRGDIQLRAIDTTFELADGHRKTVLHEAETFGKTISVEVEEAELNHLYANLTMLAIAEKERSI